MAVLVRNSRPEEAPALTALATRAKARWGYPPEWLAAWQPQLTIAASYIVDHQVLVAEEKGRLLGMCAIEEREVGWALEHLWVEPYAVGQGVGRMLVEAALDLARAARPGPIVVESDPNAAGFYLRMGAKPAGSVPAAMPGEAERVLPVFVFEAESERQRAKGERQEVSWRARDPAE